MRLNPTEGCFLLHLHVFLCLFLPPPLCRLPPFLFCSLASSPVYPHPSSSSFSHPFFIFCSSLSSSFFSSSSLSSTFLFLFLLFSLRHSSNIIQAVCTEQFAL